MAEYFGIDVSKNQLDVCWLKELKAGRKKAKKIANRFDQFKVLSKWLLKQSQSEPCQIVITMEATGAYHEALAYYLFDEGYKLIISNPGKAKKFSESIGQNHKTDQQDAYMLARYGASQADHLSLWQPEKPEIRALKAMIRRLNALEKDCHREKNRLEASHISDSSNRVEKSIKSIIAVLESEIEALKLDIDDHIDMYPALKRNRQLLLSVKGIGNVMARELVYLFAAKSFLNAKQVASYLGLIPKLNESGAFKGRTTLSKSGPSRIRAKLYLASVSASTHNPQIKAQKERLLKSGKTKMQALCAAMRKLVQICFGVIKNQCEFQAQVDF